MTGAATGAATGTSHGSFGLPDGRRLELLVEGPEGAVPLLFFHGTPFAAAPHPRLRDRAAERGLRTVSWSRPGYGGSTRQPGRTVSQVAEDAPAVLDALGADRFVALGWSGGGPHALACAAALGDRCRGVATLGGVAPYGAEGLDWVDGMGPENVEEFAAARAGETALRSFLESAAPELTDVTGPEVAASLGGLVSAVDVAALDPPLARFLAAGMRAALGGGVEGWLDDDLAFLSDWGFDLGAVGCPVTVWQGDQDLMVPAAHGAWLAAHLPGCRAELRTGEGHLSLLNERLGSVLDDLASAARSRARAR